MIQSWIVSSLQGRLGGIGFGAATLQLAPRDQRIGWSNEACIATIGQVVCNQRFLILPGVRVPKLAAHVLKLACARIADDWQAKYHVRPVLA